MALPPNIGKYRVEKRLGEGGMGTVYLAHDEGIDRHVAIKVLRADDEDMRRRFRSEARSVGRLKHSNIVTVYDYSEFEGSPCIVMEYVDGETLAALIKRHVDLPDVRKLHLIEQVCRGLAYAHRAGIVHRDIKPSNLMLNEEGTIKIVDFGIARSGERGLTLTGKVIGTLAYMAPEQARGESVDRRSDIFAIGLVLYEFLSGRGAFPGDSDYSIINRIVSGDPEPFRHPDGHLSELIIPVIDGALAKAPDQRFQDADQMAAALAGVRARLESQPKPEPHPRGTLTEVQSRPNRAVPPNLRSPAATADTASPTVMREDAADTFKLPVQSPRAAARPSVEATATPSIPVPRADRWKWTAAVTAIAALGVAALTYLPSDSTQSGEAGQPRSSSVDPADTGPAARVPLSAPVAAPTSVQAPPGKEVADRLDASPRSVPARTDKPAVGGAPNVTTRLADASRLFEDGDYAAAVLIYEEVLADDPGNPAAESALKRVKRAQESEARFVRGAVTVPRPTDEQTREINRHLAEARRRHEEAEYDAAIAAYGAALKIDPANSSALTGLAATRKAQAAEAAAMRLKKKPGVDFLQQ